MIHGEIKVNHNEIMEYRIENAGPGIFDTYNYEAFVRGTDNRGYGYTFQFDFDAEGTAPYLVMLVMAEVDRRLRT